MAVWWLQLTTTTTTATTRWTTTTTTATVTNNRNRNIRDKRTQTETYRNNRSKTTSWWAVTKLLLLRFKIPKSARCNIQYAVDPMSSEFRIIEVNARHLAGRMVFLGAFFLVEIWWFLKVNSQQYPWKKCRLPSEVLQRNFRGSRWFVGIFWERPLWPFSALT